MMDFDQLVRKYLSGSLSDAELDEFRDLLQRVPEYRVELTQILELRSLIHDDTLKLTPPEELSGSVRAAVGGRFAQTGTEAMLQSDAQRLTPPSDLSNSVRLAVGRKFAQGMPIEEPKKKKRKGLVWIPYRIAAGAFVTASVAVILAIGPTLFAPFDNRGGEGASPIARVGSAPAPVLAELPAPSSAAVADNANVESVVPEGVASERSVPGAGSAALAGAGRSASSRSGSESGVASQAGTRSVARAAVSLVPLDNSSIDQLSPASQKQNGNELADLLEKPSVQPAILALENPLELLKPVGTVGSLAYNPVVDTSNQHITPITLARSISIARTEVPGEERRLLAVGVTVGSGSVDATSPTVLMGGSCYFSFSVSGQDRVGVEMGGSTFQQEHSQNYLSGVFAKQIQGMPGDGSDVGESPASPSSPVVPQPRPVQRLKQQITFGGVFYDRRVVKINDKWDINGRITFGGADGSLVSSLRAYGSFSPSKNVSLTMGVGGSALYDLSSKKTWGSGNYGIYYGVETGF